MRLAWTGIPREKIMGGRGGNRGTLSTIAIMVAAGGAEESSGTMGKSIAL